MCGIAGELSLRESPSGADWDLLVRLMERRGPDDSGHWTDGRQCTLSFRRLAIQDLSPEANQPMATSDGRYRLVYNGEVYNFPDLRSELEGHGVRFRTRGDTEVVLQALARWGTDALNRFDGMFALAFWDTRERRLLLARDPLGVKPLYYGLSPEGAVFASQYDQILNHPWFRAAAIDPDGVALYFRLAYIPAPYALLRGTHMLTPGSWIRIDTSGQTTAERYFSFPTRVIEPLEGSAVDDRVEATVQNAVESQLISDVPIGGFLSGGIDSPLICAHATAARGPGFPGYTLSVPGDPVDEAPDARRYAAEIGLTHVVREARQQELIAAIERAADACGEPFADYSILPTLLICERAREDVKVLLSGDGGDELFWGYAGRFARLLRHCEDFRHPYWFRSLRWAAKKYLSLGGGYPNLRFRSLGHWYQTLHTRLPPAWLRRLSPELPPWPEAYDVYRFDGWDRDATADWLRWNELVDNLPRVLLKVDRASMYSSLEVRVPLLARDLVATATRLRWTDCLDIERALGKLPLRAALARRVRHQTTAKRGFAVPMDSWLRGPLRTLFEDVVLPRDELLGLPIDRTAVRGFFRDHLQGVTSQGWGLWILLSAALWQERHYDAARSSSQRAVS